MNFTQLLKVEAESRNSIICLGLDPMVERIPLKDKSNEAKITKFCTNLIKSANNIGALKPNYAYFAQYGFGGLRALKKTIEAGKKKGIPVILDAKRGDIGASSAAYAREVFDFWKADAVTVSPYMGSDSVEPFLQYCEKGKGVYVLVRTSNPGATDIQETESEDGKLFMKTAERLMEWEVAGTGAVVGATNLAELEQIHEYFDRKVPLLIPGVGNQGANASEVADILRDADMGMHRINSSSGITYAYEKDKSKDYVDSALAEIEKLNKEIKYHA